jgi:hypothetical protein
MNKLVLVTAGLLLTSLPTFGQGASDADERRSLFGRRDHDTEELLRALGLGDELPGGRGALRGGAGFFLRSGDAIVAVRCDPRESMRTCLDLTTTLLDKARSALPSGGGGGPPSRQ